MMTQGVVLNKFLGKIGLYIGMAFIVFGQSDMVLAQNAEKMFFKTQDQYQKIEVETVLTADKIKLKNGDVVRLLGILAMESKKKNSSLERDSYGFMVEVPVDNETAVEDLALVFVKQLLEKKIVRLEFDANKRSMEGDAVAYVFRLDDNLFVNSEILRMGYADLHIELPNTKYADVLRAAYREARTEQRGLLAD